MIVLIIVALLFLNLNYSYAYLDPGTGSMIIQILVVGITSIAVFFKSIVRTLKSLFKK